MNVQAVIVIVLATMLALYLAILWYGAVRRRNARREAERLALAKKKASGAWQNLANSAAGAP